MPKVTVDYQARPKGSEMYVPGLGVFKNGETTDVNGLRWDRWQSRNKPANGHLVLTDKKQPPDTTLEELKKQAAELNIEGRSDMNKKQLQNAIDKARSGN